MGIYTLLIFWGGLYWMVQESRREIQTPPVNALPAWNTGWPEFLLFGSGLMFVVLVLTGLASSVTSGWEANEMLAPWRAPVVSLAFQGAILAILLTGFQPPIRFLNFRLNPRVARVSTLLKAGFRQFVISIPLVFVFAASWEGLLRLLNHLGWPISLERQALLDMFQLDQPVGLIISLVVVAVIVAPVAEELLFRGAIYRFLKGRTSARIAMIVSSLLFSAMHGYAMSFLPLFLLGMLLCRSYEREHNIMAPIFFHAFFNANTIALLLVAQVAGPIESA